MQNKSEQATVKGFLHIHSHFPEFLTFKGDATHDFLYMILQYQ
jgi:hypothetical protein